MSAAITRTLVAVGTIWAAVGLVSLAVDAVAAVRRWWA